MIRPDTYRLKDDNDDILTKRLEQLCHFLPLKFSLTIVYLAFAPIRAPRPKHFSAWVARGLNEGALLPLFFVYYHMVKLLPTRTKG